MRKVLKNLELYIAAVALFLMLVITFANILGRYLLPVAWSFTEELVCGMFILMTMLGTAAGIKRGAHLGLNVVTDLLPTSAQRIVNIFQYVVTLIFGALLFWYGLVMVETEIRFNIRTIALQWPEAIFGSFIPLGGFCIVFRSIEKIAETVKPTHADSISKNERGGE